MQCCVRVLGKSSFANLGRRRAFKLMNPISRSSVATGFLIKDSGKKLLAACPTRWSYTLLALQRLLDLQQSIAWATDQLTSIDNLRNSDWNDIDRYVKFMRRFADATHSTKGQCYTTISEVIPQLMESKHHLSLKRNEQGYRIASEKMETELSKKFDYILDPGHCNFEAIYTIATSLDPRFCNILSEAQLEAAKNAILNQLGYYSVESNEQGDNDATTAEASKLGYVSNLVRAKRQQRQHASTDASPVLKEVMGYFLNLPDEENLKSDPVDDYWLKNAAVYPHLSALAFDVLSIPATSAPVERVFSQASVALGSRRVQLSGEYLEREVMLKSNRIWCEHDVEIPGESC